MVGLFILCMETYISQKYFLFPHNQAFLFLFFFPMASGFAVPSSCENYFSKVSSNIFRFYITFHL